MKIIQLILIPVFIVVLVLGTACHHESKKVSINLPDSVYSGKHGKHHVQGIAIDSANGFVYYSFTDKLIKTDLSGNLIGSVKGFLGHIGCLAFDPETQTVFASLEYKNDKIGKGLSKNQFSIHFYIAMFDGKGIVEKNMDAKEGDVFRVADLKEVVDDYKAEVKEGDRNVKHRFGCSGIDGVTLGPSFGNVNSDQKYLYVAYGIYGDTSRKDNDYQVLLKYNIDSLKEYSSRLNQKELPDEGPEKPLAKYFVKTGNTRYGIQNLEYDAHTGNFFAAVYKGKKLQFPNYSLFVIDGHKKPGKAEIFSDEKMITVDTLSLLQAGLKDAKTGIRGWNFKWGATGLFSLGNGLFYISHNKKTGDGQQETTLYKYKWVGSDSTAFERVK